MSLALPKARDKSEYIRWFREADRNNDGFLKTKELKKMFKNKGYKTSSKQFKEHFAMLDRDGDNKVTLEEYLIGMGQIPQLTHMEGEIRAAFQAADRNGDGRLDFDEIKLVLRAMNSSLTNKQLFDIMHKADRSKSGFVDYDDFIILYLRQHGHFD